MARATVLRMGPKGFKRGVAVTWGWRPVVGSWTCGPGGGTAYGQPG